jgi:uncharacterized membrane protein (UPF0127 family)
MAPGKPCTWSLFNPRTGHSLADRVFEPRTYFGRMKGLLGKTQLEEGVGMIIPWCNAVHTFFMRMTIDVLFLDRRNQVVRFSSRVPSFRICWGGWSAHAAIELPAGTLERTGTQLGDFIQCQPNPTS